MKVDIGNLCTHCGRDTSFGSVDENGEQLLLFVNRIPSGANGKLVLDGGADVTIDVTIDGYMCWNCQAIECDHCGKLALDYEILDNAFGTTLCTNCIEIV